MPKPLALAFTIIAWTSSAADKLHASVEVPTAAKSHITKMAISGSIGTRYRVSSLSWKENTTRTAATCRTAAAATSFPVGDKGLIFSKSFDGLWKTLSRTVAATHRRVVPSARRALLDCPSQKHNLVDSDPRLPYAIAIS